MTQFNYSIEDDYKEMDREWYALTTPSEAELASGTIRDTAGLWDLTQHELWPRIQAEGWQSLFPTVDRATIGKRVGGIKVFIGPKTNNTMRYGEFKWSIVTSGEGTRPSSAMYGYAESLNTTGTVAAYPSSSGDIYFVKVVNSLGEALDVVKYRQMEGFEKLTPGRLDLDTGPNQHVEVYMDQIP